MHSEKRLDVGCVWPSDFWFLTNLFTDVVAAVLCPLVKRRAMWRIPLRRCLDVMTMRRYGLVAKLVVTVGFLRHAKKFVSREEDVTVL